MTRYKVTTEIKENWWRRFLRWIGINKRGNFEIVFNFDGFNKGDFLTAEESVVKVLKKVDNKNMSTKTKAWVVFLLWSLSNITVLSVTGSFSWAHLCNLTWIILLCAYVFSPRKRNLK